MNSLATTSPALRPSGQPSRGQGTGTGAKEPGNAYGPAIAQTAIQSIGMSTRNFASPPTSDPEYAAAVSIIFTKATNQAIMLGTEPRHVLSTSILYQSLAHDSRFKRVAMSEAAPGDIILESAGHQATGYAGVVVDHGRIVSNSSQGAGDNSSLVEIQRNHPATAIFRYIGVQKYRSHTLANAGYNDDEPRLPAGQPVGGQWTTGGGESDVNEAVQEKLWAINNPRYRAGIAAAARSHEYDKKWIKTGKYTNKCNLAVADWIYEATGRAPGYNGRAPLAHEWADPNVNIDDWSAPFPVSQAQPGDVVAQSHEGGQNGHVGIVVAPGKTASADALKDPAGIVIINDWGFRSTVKANGGSPGDPMPVARRYIGY
jgi:hypothetical protein